MLTIMLLCVFVLSCYVALLCEQWSASLAHRRFNRHVPVVVGACCTFLAYYFT